ncbi:hypothetical protein [Methanosphaera cuniculi]|uniref:Uncharacterized protein n=1 Tax=Methanosphaera cuniculi TaxID=1077256 RepID=A0A2A2HF70_9EURY|nr:hypothetical protein [Methanosphaera cuniculi]PAV08079.1 hypothetical protein ASJ82_01040 [Methanosphaera cuniculi]PWL08166.1 hypothetical protein MSCUN_10970 [Methanosphaera cuniculi]
MTTQQDIKTKILTTHQSTLYMQDYKIPCMITKEDDNNLQITYHDHNTDNMKKIPLSKLRKNNYFKGIEYINDGIIHIEVKI